jgi:serine/threonine-protein kinase
MADVFLCRRHGIGGFHKQVVVKRIRADVADRDEYIDMFLDEARVAANLTHPNIVQVFEIDTAEGLPYIVMEYVPGKTLASVLPKIAARDSITYGSVAHLMADACAGLHYAHNARDPDGRPLQLVHRDISPHNIIVSGEGLAKLFDFGVAKALGRIGNTDAGSGTVKGKIAYMAPEQMRARPVDSQADVYAIGVCLYEATTGRRPFLAATEAELFAVRMEGKFPLPSELVPGYPPELEQIVLHAMADSPSSRPTAAELEDELRAFAASRGAGVQQVAKWLSDLCPDHFEPPLRRSSSRFEAQRGGCSTKVMIATGSQKTSVSDMAGGASAAQAAQAAPAVHERPGRRRSVALAALLLAGTVAGYLALGGVGA